MREISRRGESPLPQQHQVAGQIFTGANNNRITADLYGPSAGAPVLFLHGGGQSRSAWKRGAIAAGKAGYRAIAIDLRGHGDSQWAPDGDYRFATYAADIAAIIESIGRQAALVGASLGGRAAILAAARHADRVSAILLVDVAPRINDSATREMRAFFARSRGGFADLSEAADALASLAERRGRDEPGRLAAHLREERGRLYWRWDPRFTADEFISDPCEIDQLEAAAQQIRVPALLVRAGLSTVVSPEHLESFRRLMPQAEVREVPGIGHMLTGDANDAYAPLIVDFLKRHLPAGAPI